MEGLLEGTGMKSYPLPCEHYIIEARRDLLGGPVVQTRNAVGKRRGEKCDFKEQFEELVRFSCSRPDQQDI